MLLQRLYVEIFERYLYVVCLYYANGVGCGLTSNWWLWFCGWDCGCTWSGWTKSV